MSKSFKNLGDLEKYINQQAQKVLKNEVAEKVKDVMQSKVKTEVYDAYTSYSDHPDAYVRRMYDGGLIDRDNMISNINGNTLSIENTTKGYNSGERIDGLIEYGNNNGYGNYDYYPASKSEGDFRKPRPFIEATRQSLESTKDHEKAMADGLKKNGINVK